MHQCDIYQKTETKQNLSFKFIILLRQLFIKKYQFFNFNCRFFHHLSLFEIYLFV